MERLKDAGVIPYGEKLLKIVPDARGRQTL